MLKQSLVPISIRKSWQNLETNLVLQSDMMDRGIPCSCTTSLTYKFASCSAVKSDFNGKKVS